MTVSENTLLLRFAGAMQSWGTSSRFQLRRSDPYPSKSGVFGLLLCAMGIRREDSNEPLQRLSSLRMGIRIDNAGSSGWDYHSAGAGYGIRSADGKIKITASTGEFETLLSRRQYLYDASFLIALQGDPDIIRLCEKALDAPTWPIYLGRKSCIPSEPVLIGTGAFDTLEDALSSQPWSPLFGNDSSYIGADQVILHVLIEHEVGSPPPPDALLVYDVPIAFGFMNYHPRWIMRSTIEVPVVQLKGMRHVRNGISTNRRPDYTSRQWKDARIHRLQTDGHLCVFCKSPAQDVHHVTYSNVGHESDEDLRSLCKLCHDACTMLEYGRDMQHRRIDPADPSQRDEILEQINRLLNERRLATRRELLESSRLNISPPSSETTSTIL